MIRGAIAFGLVLQLPANEHFTGEQTIQTSILAIVIITTVGFGFFTPFLARVLMPEVERKRQARKEKKHEQEHQKKSLKKKKEEMRKQK